MGETNPMAPELNAPGIRDVLDIKSAGAVAHGLSGRFVHAATQHGMAEDPQALQKAW